MPTATTVINGFVAPGFERVRDVVEQTPNPFGRGGGSISAYHHGELVVDLWGGWKSPGVQWEEHTLATIASITKSWAACVVHRLVEQGVLDFTTPVATWWPEFAAEGKGGITLREIFMHTNGVLGFEGQADLLYKRAGWGDYDAIADGLAKAKPVWSPGSQSGYHAVSFGWLVQEVVRRTTGRTIGDIFRTDFAEPLGLESYLGVPKDRMADLATCMVPDVPSLPTAARMIYGGMLKKGADPKSLAGIAFISDGTQTILEKVEALAQQESFVTAEVPASNGVSTTRGLAKLFMCLANGGTLDGVTVLQPSSVDLMRKVQGVAKDSVAMAALPAIARLIQPVKTQQTYGLIPNHKVKGKDFLGPNPDAFASAGYGGQVVMGDPTLKASFAGVFSDFTPGLEKLHVAVRDVLFDAFNK